MTFFGSPIRRIQSSNQLFLTFDDGPEPISTYKILETLARENVKSTFFVVAQTAQKQKQLLREIIEQGHSVGNHSLDHGYANYFRGRASMLGWVDESEKILTDLVGGTVGFRPPAGVRTPELAWSLKKLDLHMILWNQRFFDTTISWKPDRARNRVKKTKPGSIILLHDRQRPSRLPLFLKALQVYIESAREYGLSFSPLTKNLILDQIPRIPKDGENR